MPDFPHDMPDNVPGPLGAALRIALQRYLRAQLEDRDLHAAVRRWVTRAKGEGLRAEELILLFNDLWTSLPEVQRAPPLKQRSIREDLISECIEDYYEDVD